MSNTIATSSARPRSRAALAALAALGSLLASLLAAREARALDPSKHLGECAVEVWGNRDGLAGGMVRALAQTPDGYLWIAGYGGVARYDGARILHMEIEPPQDIAGLATDRDGVMHVAPRRGPALCARGSSLSSCARKLPAMPGSLRVFGFSRDRLGGLWSSTDRGAYRVTGPGAAPDEPAVITGPFGELAAVRRDGRGRLWLGGNTGLFVVEGGRHRLAEVDGQRLEAPVRSIFERRGGGLWALTDAALLSIEDGGITRHPLPAQVRAGSLSEVIEDQDGNVWAGTPAGLVRFRDGRFDLYTKKDGLPDDDVTAIFEDRERSLWIGTRGGSVAQFTERTVPTKYGPPSLRGESIESVSEDAGGAMWFGTRLGLTRWKDGVERTFTTADGLPSDRVYATYPGRQGEVWVGTLAGLVRWRNDRAEHPFPAPFTAAVFSLYMDRAGTLWIGTGGGLYQARDGRVSAITALPPFRPQQVRGIQEDDAGVLWITSYGGMGRMREGKLVEVSDPQVPDVMRADRGISRDNQGTLWFGAGTSLVRLRSGKFRAFTAAAGLPRDWLFQVLADDHGWLWFATSRTISRVALAELEAVDAGQRSLVAVTSFSASDTRQEIAARRSRTPGAWKGRDGRLWFATLHGVVTIAPDRIRTNQQPPPVLIEKAMVNGVIAEPGRLNQFPPGPGNIEVQYAGVTLLESRKALHRYRLEGFDGDWVDAGTRRVASYANIPPGDYRFRVQASNADGIWNHTGASVELRLLPHFYRTGWFYLLTAATLAALAFALYRARLLRLRGQYLAVFAERSRVARELHDSLLQGMSAVALEIENIRGQIPAQAADAARRLTAVQDALTTSLEETRRFVWNLREQPTASSDLGTALQRLCGRLTEGRALACEVIVEGPPKHLSHDVQGTLFSVAQEAVTNALKHAAPARIEVRLRHGREDATLTVSDDGRGFDVATAQGPEQGHFGLLGMRERARRLGAHIMIDSRPGAGTRVVLTVPLSARSPDV